MRDPGVRLLQQLDDDALFAMMEAVLLVANADGAFGEDEHLFFRSRFGALAAGRLNDAHFKAVKERLEERLAQVGPEPCVEQIRRRMPERAAREAALILAHDMAMVDGVLVDRERQILLMLATAFGVADSDRHELFDGPAVQVDGPEGLAQTT